MIFRFLKQAGPAPGGSALSSHTVGGRTLPLQVRHNARAKNITLRIEPGARGLKVTVPPGVDDAEIEHFLARQSGWLKGKLDLVPDQPALAEGMKVPIRGVPHLIVRETGRGVSHQRDTDAGAQLVVYGDGRFVARRVADYLKNCAKQDIEPLVQHHTKTLGRPAKSIRYKDTKSRWGSCSSDGNLSFSWRIMMAPPAVINYLVAHEVAHLKHMDHSPRFWAQCEALCPDMKRAKDWLKRNGTKLQAIGLG
ncbi:MAG: M48 family metallopeptidase [Ahrensia sp.]